MDDNSIRITKEQFEEWFEQGGKGWCRTGDAWTHIKKHVEKPKRREFSLVNTISGNDLVAGKYLPESYGLHVKEVLPGDIGPMTKDEARVWVEDAWVKMHPYTNVCLSTILKALGLTP